MNEFKVKNGIVIDNTTPINNISNDYTLSGNSDSTLVTESAIVSYVNTIVVDIQDELDLKLDVSAYTPFNSNAYTTTASFNSHTTNTSNPHSVTKTQVGLSNVDNTSDADKPISTATQTALNSKFDTSGISNYTTTASFNSHVGSGGSSHAVATSTVNGFMLSADKVKLDSLGASNGDEYSLNVVGATSGSWVDSGINVNQVGLNAKRIEYVKNGVTSSILLSSEDFDPLLTQAQLAVISADLTSNTLTVRPDLTLTLKPIQHADGTEINQSATVGQLQTALNSKFDTSGISNYTTTASFNSHVGSGGSSHAVVTSTVNGFMLSADKVKLDSLTSAGAYVLPVATSAVLGGVKDGTGVTILGDGVISVDYGTTSNTAVEGSHVGSTGTSHGLATTATAGFMSSDDKLFLDNIDYELVDGNGVHSGMVISIGSPTSTFSISSGEYHKIGGLDSTYAGVTNQIVTNIATQDQTYIAIDITNNSILQQATPFTPSQRRTHVILGVLIHTDNTIINAVNNLPDVAQYTLAQLNDFMDGLKGFNLYGNVISANGANLSINKSAGELFKKGSNFAIDTNNPHVKTMAPLSAPANIRMRQSNSIESANTNVLDLRYESPLGTLQSIPNNRYGVFRVVLFSSNLIRIQYPQYVYTSIATAQAGISTEQYITESNMAENGLLRGYIIVRGAATALNDTNDASFIQADKFGEMPFGGTGGGTTTLQGAYNNSIEPEIITNTTLGALSLQRGTSADTDNVLEIKNGSGGVVLYARGDGYNNFYPYEDLKDATGFTDPFGITESYDSTTRKITITGNVKALYRGRVVPELVSGWVSEAHPDTLDNYFLFYNGTSFVWQTTPWAFDVLQLAEVYHRGVNKFAVREVHGMMDPLTHQECHYNIGTWRKSGGAFSSFTPNSTTVTNRRPVLGSSIIVDEDIETENASVSSGEYTRFHLIGNPGAPTTTLDQLDITSVGGAGRFNYNLLTGSTWSVAESASNAYGKIFVVNIPVTSDAGSQKFRSVYLMPQTTSLTLATIQAISPANYNWGELTGAGVSEFVFVGEIIVRSSANNWTITSVQNITGNRFAQVSTPATPTPSLIQVLNVDPSAENVTITSAGAAVLDTDVPQYIQIKTYADGKVSQTITNGVTTSAPSQDAVFDALALKFDTSGINIYATSANLNSHITNTSNPHSVTKTQVGLSNVDNTSDLDKPISTETQTALNSKYDTSGGILNGDLKIGTMSYIAANSPVELAGDTNSYYQLVIQNKNAGSTASSDIVVNNNLSTDSTYYGDFGINSSVFTGAGSFQLPNATYLYGFSGELVLGTRSANGVRFVTNDGATDSARILSTGEWGIGATPTTGAALTLPAGIAAKAPLNIGAFSATKTSPVDGDIWKSAADSLAIRMSTNTRTFGFLEKAQTWTAAQTFSATANAFTNATDVTVGTFTTGSFYASGGASITKTLQASQISQRMQTSSTTTGSITWALGSGGNIDLTAALTGDITLAMSAAVAGSVTVCTFLQGATARAVTLTHAGVTFNLIGSTSTGSATLAIPSTEFMVNRYYALELYWATATKCFVSIIKLPATNSTSSLTKTITIEAPTASEDITMFRTDVAITVLEVIAVSTGTTPSTTYQLKHGTDRDSAGTAVTTSVATTGKTTGDIATLSDATIPADSWIWVETTAASGTGVSLTIDLRYTID